MACTAEGIEPELWGDIVGLKETHSKAKYIFKKNCLRLNELFTAMSETSQDTLPFFNVDLAEKVCSVFSLNSSAVSKCLFNPFWQDNGDSPSSGISFNVGCTRKSIGAVCTAQLNQMHISICTQSTLLKNI